jgi:hypothetical protein
VDDGAFEITLDDGSKATVVQPELLPHLRNETTLVMSVVAFRVVLPQQKTVLCPSCTKRIPVQVFAQRAIESMERVFWCVEIKFG